MNHRSFVGKMLTATLFLFFAFASKPGAAQSLIQKPITKTVNSVIGGYYEALPLDYATNTTKKYPLLVFLHGLGEIGNGSQASLPAVLRNGPPKLIANGTFPATFTSNGQTFSFIVISPQMNTQDRTGNSIQSLMDYLVQTYRVDESRIYLTGLSMGGGISWIYAGTKAWTSRLAALAPVCGNTSPYDAFVNNITSANLPVWALHNEGDPTVASQLTKDWISKLNSHVPALNPKARGTIFPVSGHDAWSKAYDPAYRENGLNVYEWLLAFSKNGATITPNLPPTVNAGTDKTLTLPASSVTLSASAADPDGSIAAYAWTKVAGPASYSFSSTAVASPTVSNLVEGTYTFRLTVTDNKGAKASDDINVVVNPSTAPIPVPAPGGKSVQVNVFGGANAYSNAQWNNWNVGAGTVTNVSSSAFKYTDGTLSVIKATLSQSTGMGDNGSMTAGMAPAEVLRYASYSTVGRTLILSGLTPGKKYDLEFYASRNNNSGNDTKFLIGNRNYSVNSYNNSTDKALFTAVAADAQGKIAVDIQRTKTYTYLNGFKITESGSTDPSINLPPTVNAGTDKTLTLPASSVTLSASAADPDGSIAAYAWTKVAGPASYGFSSTAVASPTVSNLVEGTYTFRLTVTDNKGAKASDDINVVVNPSTAPIPVPAPGGKSVQVNVFGGANAYSNAQWNNWNVGAGTVTNVSSSAFKYTDGTLSVIKATLSQSTGMGDNGSMTAGMAPAEVLRYASYSTVGRTLILSGLTPGKKYDLEFYASRNNNSGNDTKFLIGNRNYSVNSYNNSTDKALFTAVAADAQGKIAVDIQRTKTYTYLNGFKITESGNGTTTTLASAKTAETLSATEETSAFAVFPNPFTDRVVLQVNNTATGQMNVQVADLAGAIRKTFTLSKPTGSTQTYLSLGDLPTGVYILTVQIGDWTESKKISKQ